jgi:hypothetical protein
MSLLENVQKVFDSLNKKRGPFALFALLMPADADRWDLIISAPALKDSFESYKIVVKEVQSFVPKNEMPLIDRIEVFDTTQPTIQEFLATMPKETRTTLYHFVFGGTRIKQAEIIYGVQSKPKVKAKPKPRRRKLASAK